MNPISDTMLMAYADGELDATERAQVEQALLADVALRARLDRHLALGSRVQAAYRAVLDEPVPDRLLQAVAAPLPAATVTSLAEHRERRQRAAAGSDKSDARDAWGWARWGGMAASVALGVLVAQALPRLQAPAAGDLPFAAQGDGLVARGAVAQALSSQLAGSAAAPGTGVAVQLSFVDREGRYCRTFQAASLAGLACREGDNWSLQVLAAGPSTPASAPADGLRQAASALPAAVLSAIDARIEGAPLDARAEAAARDRQWRR